MHRGRRLQAQLDVLEAYRAERGLTVNLGKTKFVLLAGADSEEDAPGRGVGRSPHLRGTLEAAPELQYLGVVFHCCRPLGSRRHLPWPGVARFAAALFEGCCAELGLEATAYC